MSISWRRIRAIIWKELYTYRRARSIVWAMVIIPLVFLIQPLVSLFATPSARADTLRHHHELLYMLAIPALVPATLAAYAVVGERQQGTLEPVLDTPIRRRELVLGKALAVFLPSVAVAYLVFGLFLALVALVAHAGVASAFTRGSDVLAKVIFTPLVTAWSIWVGLAISTRGSEMRVAQQLSVLASLPTIAVTTLTALNVIHPPYNSASAWASCCWQQTGSGGGSCRPCSIGNGSSPASDEARPPSPQPLRRGSVLPNQYTREAAVTGARRWAGPPGSGGNESAARLGM
jgi:ABC-2 type transport system permease protein